MWFSAPNLSLVKLSKEARLSLLGMIYASGGGHIGGSLSSLDILVNLYNSNIFNFSSHLQHADKFILSAGHLCTALYVVLAQKGLFSPDLLSTYASYGSPLQGHVSSAVPGVNYSSGSLGQGLSFAAGMALGSKNSSVVCLTTDGEHQEGQIWEAAMFASKYSLSNLINIIDVNGFQIDGSTSDIMPLGDLAAKYIRFGWTVISVNGHNHQEISRALLKAKTSTYPTCIIAKTILGKGISFMENNFSYHDVKSLDKTLYERAREELDHV